MAMSIDVNEFSGKEVNSPGSDIAGVTTHGLGLHWMSHSQQSVPSAAT